MNLSTVLGLGAEMMPTQECLNDGVSWAYMDLARHVDGLADLLSGYGLEQGATIATMQELSGTHVAVMFAAWNLGYRLLPLNFRMRPAELAVALVAVQPSVLICDRRYGQVVAESIEGLLTSPQVVVTEDVPGQIWQGDAAAARGVAGRPPLDVHASDTAVVLLTSGTTGTPKQIHLAHGDLFADVARRMEPPTGESRGKTLLSVPSYHIAGIAHVLSSLYTGRAVYVMKQFNPEAWLEKVESERINYAFVVPTMLKRIVDSPNFRDADLSSLRLLSYGAGPASPDLIEEVVRRFPDSCDLANAYGQTETRGTITILGPDDHRRALVPGSSEDMARLGSVGRPVAGVELEILGKDGRVLSRGEIGEVAVTALSEGSQHRTGDRGYLDEAGYLFLVGRTSDLIIRGGENIDPLEIERHLDLHPNVKESAAVGIPDSEWGEIIAAFIVPHSQAPLPATEALGEFLRTRLASFKVPDRYVCVSELPRNSMGKILRSSLRDRLESE